MEKNIENLLEEFNVKADDSKMILHLILSSISEGKVPKEEDMIQLNSSIDNLRKNYDSILSLAASQIPIDEMPNEGASVTEYAEALRNSVAMQYKRQLEDIKNILADFVSVKSFADNYTKAFMPYKRTAEDLISRISGENDLELKDIEEEVLGPKVFLEALTCEDIDSDEGMALLDQVDKFYSQRVQNGLAARKYYLPEKESSYNGSVTKKGKDAEIISDTDPSEQEKKDAELNEKSHEIIPESIDSTYEETVEDEIDINGTDDRDETEFSDKEMLQLSFSIKNELQAPLHPKSLSPFGVKAFKSDINGSLKEIRIDILKESENDFIDASYIEAITLEEKDIIIQQEEYLYNKGYLKQYYLDNCSDEHLYTLSAKGIQAFKSKESLRYLNVNNKGKVLSELTVEDSSDYLLRLLYLKAKAYIILQKDSCHCLWREKYGLVWDGEDKKILCVVANIEEDDHVDFLSLSEEVEEFENTIQQLYVLSYNQDICQNLMALTVISLNVGLEDIHIEIYSYTDDKWYIISSGEEDYNEDLTGEPLDEENQETEVSEEEPLQLYSVKEISEDITPNVAPRIELSVTEDNKEESSENQISDSVNDIALENEQESSEDQIVHENYLEVENDSADEEYQDNNEGDITEEKSLEAIIQSSGTPDEDTFIEIINNLINTECLTEKELEETIVSGILLAGTAAMIPDYENCRKLYKKIALATRTTWNPRPYSFEELSDVFTDFDLSDECVAFASYLFAMLLPEHSYDYSLKAQVKEYRSNFESFFPNLQFAKELFNKLSGVQGMVAEGFTDSVVALLGDTKANDQFISNLKTKAEMLLTVSTPKIHLVQLPNMYSNCFGQKSDIYKGLEIITQNNKNELEYIQLLLQEYCDESENGIYALDPEKIDFKISEEWKKACSKKQFPLEYEARDIVRRSFRERLDVIVQWAEYTTKVLSSNYDIERLRVLRKEIRKLAGDVKELCKRTQLKNKNVLIWMLDQIEQQLSSKPNKKPFSCLLLTGIIPVSEDYLPIINEEYTKVKYYEPWRNVLRHISMPKQSFTEVVDNILELKNKSIMFDNLRQLVAIKQLGVLTEDYTERCKVSDNDLIVVKKKANEFTETFLARLDLDYTFSRLTELQKENLTILVDQNKEKFYELREFGCWKQFLNALHQQAEDINKSNLRQLQNELKRRYKSIRDYGSCEILDEAKRLLEEEKNFAVAEEYINRFDNGERNIRPEITRLYRDEESFEKFISPEVFDPIYKVCNKNSGGALKYFGITYLKNNIAGKHWTSRHKSDSEDLIKLWPIRKGNTSTAQIRGMFEGLGFDVENVKKVSDKHLERFLLAVYPVERSLPDYRHPISIFGTKMETPFNVVILYGKHTAQQLVDEMSSTDYGPMPIVLVDYPLDNTIRRQMCELFHNKSMQNPFIVIDQVLYLYLALHEDTERLPLLLKCTLPYTKYQPFVRDGGSVADEMFAGRTRELNAIIDPNGASVVYGGRQLGKTALLERAESRCHQPNDQVYAVYCSVINCDGEEKLVQTLLKAIRKKITYRFKDCTTIEELCEQIEELYDRGRIKRMLLLVDEADKFLSSIANERYEQIQPLIDLKRRTKNNFKFVIAGLHNVCRAKNATIENGVFGQLGQPLCIKPLSSVDALQLLSRPMQYIGFRLEENTHLATVLTKTNYYPGILQFFGYTLTETLHSQYKNYFSAAKNNPPFILTDKQLGSVMNQSDLNKSIRDKFLLTLELDERYYMIARCIGILYHLNEGLSGTWSGASVKQIMSIAQEYEIKCLRKLDKYDYVRLLDEMVDMGILLKPEELVYRLRRRTFLDYIGRDFDTIDSEITEHNKETH